MFFYLLEDFYIFCDHVDVSFLFLLEKDFYVNQEHIDAFCLFLLQFKVPNLSRGLKAFFSFSDNIGLTFWYIGKKLWKNIWSVFLYALEISFMSYINNMSYVNNMSIFVNHFKSNKFFHLLLSSLYIIRMNWRHQEYKYILQLMFYTVFHSIVNSFCLIIFIKHYYI